MTEGKVLAIITAAGGGMAAAVGALFKRLMKTGDEVAELKGQVGELRGQQAGIKQLSADVLQTVEDATRRRRAEDGNEGEPRP